MLLLCVAWPGVARAQSPARGLALRAAVLPLRQSSDLTPGLTSSVEARIRAVLVRSGSVELLEAGEQDEKLRGQPTCKSEGFGCELAQARHLRVDRAIAGSLAKEGEALRLSLALVDGGAQRILHEVVVRVEGDAPALLDRVEPAVRRLIGLAGAQPEDVDQETVIAQPSPWDTPPENPPEDLGEDWTASVLESKDPAERTAGYLYLFSGLALTSGGAVWLSLTGQGGCYAVFVDAFSKLANADTNVCTVRHAGHFAGGMTASVVGLSLMVIGSWKLAARAPTPGAPSRSWDVDVAPLPGGAFLGLRGSFGR